jgi:2-C-methyl-D-erythritol 2,4-cyclodiphosphate synthase
VSIRVGLGFDVHPFGADRPLVLGGVMIPDAPGLAGHSDADAVAHAVADALLSAAGLTDLGTRYPAVDDVHRNAASVGFLVEIAGELAASGWTIANVGVVIAAEQPRLRRTSTPSPPGSPSRSTQCATRPTTRCRSR